MWKDSIIQDLLRHHLFEDTAHSSRFKELLDCYYTDFFFTPGVVKCMYLSSWDDEHFLLILDMLNKMKFGTNIGLDDMAENGEFLAEELTEHRYDQYVLQLSGAFLQNAVFSADELPDDLEPEGIHIITQALKASAVIDSIPFYR